MKRALKTRVNLAILALLSVFAPVSLIQPATANAWAWEASCSTTKWSTSFNYFTGQPWDWIGTAYCSGGPWGRKFKVSVLCDFSGNGSWFGWYDGPVRYVSGGVESRQTCPGGEYIYGVVAILL